MKEVPKVANVNCEWFLNELEAVPSGEVGGATPGRLFLRLPPEARAHAGACAACRTAMHNFTETRLALVNMEATLPEPGPWFTRQVMNAIAVQEEEMEERQNGLWIGVRRLAPRLVALAMLILMLGGTWAFQERRATRQHGPELRPAEGIFETPPTTPVNDDVIASAHEVSKP
jgi:hypothetical protein